MKATQFDSLDMNVPVVAIRDVVGSESVSSNYRRLTPAPAPHLLEPSPILLAHLRAVIRTCQPPWPHLPGRDAVALSRPSGHTSDQSSHPVAAGDGKKDASAFLPLFSEDGSNERKGEALRRSSQLAYEARRLVSKPGVGPTVRRLTEAAPTNPLCSFLLLYSVFSVFYLPVLRPL